MADNNVFILFEEIKTALKGINNKLEELPQVVAQAPQSEANVQDLSPIKEVMVVTAKAQSEILRACWQNTGRHTHKSPPLFCSTLTPSRRCRTSKERNRSSTRRSISISTASTSNPRKSFLLS